MRGFTRLVYGVVLVTSYKSEGLRGGKLQVRLDTRNYDEGLSVASKSMVFDA